MIAKSTQQEQVILSIAFPKTFYLFNISFVGNKNEVFCCFVGCHFLGWISGLEVQES